MSKCSACGFESAEGSKFCKNCGTSLTAGAVCPACGVQILPNDVFCANCGFTLKPTQSAPIATVPVSAKPKKKFFKTRFAKIGLPIIAVALVAAIVVTGLFIFDKKSGINYTLYIKDNEICFSSLKNPEPYELTERFIDGDTDDYMISNLKYISNDIIQCTDDGKTMFFIDNYDGYEYDLYYRSAKCPDKEAVKIDSNIGNYYVSVKGDYVTYLKDGNLYQHDLKNKKKIDSDVAQVYYLSEDGGTVIYVTHSEKYNDGGWELCNLHYWQRGKDSKEIDDYIDYIAGVTEDVKDVFYIKEGTLYKNTLGKDSQKISDNVGGLVSVYPSGEVYYLKAENKLSIKDFIDDDMADADAKAEKPIEPTLAPYPEAPSSSDYEKIEYGYYYNYTTTDLDAYYAARDVWEAECNRINDEYSAKYREYEEKLDDYYEIEDREELRERIDEAEDKALLASLCYYDGKEEHILTEDIVPTHYIYEGFQYFEHSYDVPVIMFKACKDIDDYKIKLSDISVESGTNEIEYKIQEKLYDTTDHMLAFKNTVSSVETKNFDNIAFSQDGKTVYFTTYENEDEHEDRYNDEDYEAPTYDLYKMTVSGGKADKPKLYKDDVNDFLLSFDGKVGVIKNLDKKENTCDLYVDGEKIDSDVYYHQDYWGAILETGKYYYFTDYDEEDACGTLKIFDSKKSIEIDDDVYDVSIIPNGDIVYLRDYSVKSSEGDLYSYRNKKTEEIDTDVTSIVDITSTKAMYEYGYLVR